MHSFRHLRTITDSAAAAALAIFILSIWHLAPSLSALIGALQ